MNRLKSEAKDELEYIFRENKSLFGFIAGVSCVYDRYKKVIPKPKFLNLLYCIENELDGEKDISLVIETFLNEEEFNRFRECNVHVNPLYDQMIKNYNERKKIKKHKAKNKSFDFLNE